MSQHLVDTDWLIQVLHGNADATQTLTDLAPTGLAIVVSAPSSSATFRRCGTRIRMPRTLLHLSAKRLPHAIASHLGHVRTLRQNEHDVAEAVPTHTTHSREILSKALAIQDDGDSVFKRAYGDGEW